MFEEQVYLISQVNTPVLAYDGIYTPSNFYWSW